MAVRKPKPTSPGLRFVTYSDFAEITKVGPEKSLTRASRSPVAATTTAARRRAIVVAVPSASTA